MLRFPRNTQMNNRCMHTFRDKQWKWSSPLMIKSMLFSATSVSGLMLYFACKNIVHSRDQDGDSDLAEQELYRDSQFKPVVEKCRELIHRLKDEVGIPGLVVGVTVDGNTVWEEGFGFADIENRVNCRPETVMRIASISKAITMTAVAKLWQSGKLDLDVPIQNYVPKFPLKVVNGEKVTISCRHLVSHLSGIRHYSTTPVKSILLGSQDIKRDQKKQYGNKEVGQNPEFSLKEYYIKDKFLDVHSALELFKDDDLVSKPGSKFLYTTHGWTLISAIVEKVAEESFTAHITKLFKALGMYNTYLDENDPLIYYRSRNYVKNKKGRIENAPYVDNSYKWAGGGFLSTVGDLIKFGNSMLYSLQYIPEETNTDFTDRKNTDYLTEKARSIVDTKTSSISGNRKDDKNFTSDSFVGRFPGFLHSETVKTLWSPVIRMKEDGPFYGMGWAMNPSEKECEYCNVRKLSVYHTGGAIGASSVLLILPTSCEKQNTLNCIWSCPPKGVVVAILSNLQEVSLSKAALEIANLFEEELSKPLLMNK